MPNIRGMMAYEPQRPLSGLSVLVVHADPYELDSLLAALEAAGAIVVGVRTVDSAIGYAAATRFDTILVDVDLAGSVLRELRGSRLPTVSAPVFAVIGEGRDDRAGEPGFSGYFHWPRDRDAVVATLAALLRRT